MTQTTLPLPLTGAALALLLLAGCNSSLDAAMDSVSRPFQGATERRTTAHVDFNTHAMSPIEAQHKARANCGEAEVLRVTQPEVIGEDHNGETLYRVTAHCLATYDRRGRLIPNAPQDS